MDIADVDLVWAERDADQGRRPSYDPNGQLTREYTRIHAERAARQAARSQSHHSTTSQLQGEEAHEEAVEEVEGYTHGRSVKSHGTQHESTSSSTSISSQVRPDGARSRGMSTISRSSTKMERMLMEYIDRHPTAVGRMQDHRLQHMQTVGSRKDACNAADLPDFGAGKPYPPPLPDREEYVVEFSGQDDPRHAQNWPMRKKLYISVILIFDSFGATFASSIFSAASGAVGAEFGKGREVVTLGTSLFVLGYACGPVIFAPISELYGRRVPIIFGALGFAVFNTGVAVAKDYQTLMICRFFAGFMGSCPLTLCAAVFADMFNNETRGVAVALFSATLMIGPFSGPMIGGFLTKTIGWRWTAWIPAFIGYFALVLCTLFQSESYGPVILVSKAAELRRLTRNWGIHAKQEEVEIDLKELAVKNISRPLRILFTEPIVLVVTIYMSFIYGLLYLNLTAYSLVFQGTYGWSLGVAGIPYMALVVGAVIGLTCIVLMNKSYVKKLKANNNIPVPEWRLVLTMPAGIIFACGLFWFGWGGYMSSTPWIVPTLAGVFIGFGIYAVFLQCLNYIIDAYLMFAASAIAANTIMRSLFGAIFPLFATYMFEGIGINWGMTLLGCVAALFIPMPFLLYGYGKKLRARSKFAPAPDIEQDKRRDEESRGKTNTEGSDSPDAGSEEKKDT